MKKLPVILPWSLLLLAMVLWSQSLWIYAKAQLAQQLIAHSWAQSLQQHTSMKPWPWADTWPVAKLSFPARAQVFYVLEGANGSALAFGPGMDPQSNNRLTIIHGHRDTHFALLQELQPGEPVELQRASGETQVYRIAQTDIVDSAKQQWLVDPNQPALQLITCYPFDAISVGGSLRYVVEALPAEPAPQETLSM